MKISIATASILILLYSSAIAQTIELSDDFESSSEGLEWFGGIAEVNQDVTNPFPSGINTSSGVLEYIDYGQDYSYFRVDAPLNFDLTENSTFTLKLYVPSSSITGEQPNQIAFKLQNANLAQPWVTQTEIIKSIVLDEWQELSFDFSTDEFNNQNNASPAPTERFDLNRVLIQVNGEANTDLVTAYIDDFSYDGVLDPDANPTTSIYNSLVWADEFETDGAVNPINWHHQTQLPNSWGWHNSESQHYTDRIENSYVADGNLHIAAKRETFTDQGLTREFTSARLNSKFAFTYGRVVARAILPEGGGTWPAIWMLGKNISEEGGYWAEEFGTTGWPACGEIDIMEHWGYNQNVISAALHTPSSFGATENHATIFDENVSQDYHIYEMEWSPEEIKFSLDGSVYYVYAPEDQNPETWPFTADQYILLNIATEENVSPAFEESEMILDYIRVYQEGNPTSTRTEENIELNIYPNPAKDVLTVASSITDRAQIEIYTVTGVKVLSQQTTGAKTVVSLNELPAGSYVVNFRNSQSFKSVPFVKMD
ncbi:MAG: family 16 glycosylhydrolase [Cryomorphaceae bacterium]